MVFEAIMTALLAYQIMMPQVNNGKFVFQIAPDGSIVRMNTQNGAMERCSADFRCGAEANLAAKEQEYKY